MYPTLILNSRTPLTITLKGNETQFELAGVRVRDGPLENFFLGGGEYKNNICARYNQMKKNSCTPINPKKYSCHGLKKIHTRNLITKKNSCGSKMRNNDEGEEICMAKEHF